MLNEAQWVSVKLGDEQRALKIRDIRDALRTEVDKSLQEIKGIDTPVQRLMRQNEAITLLPAEELLRELLLGCREYIKKSEGVSSAASLEIWITGGWVRDRLLGTPCSDIDVALSTMTGANFGYYLTRYLHENEIFYQKRATEPDVQYARFSGFHITKRNAGKLKYLETAIGAVFGLDLDLVNLRKEVNGVDSRTPEMEFETIEEDAFRRDATVNALFFDLDSRQVVDPTKKGLDDMAACTIRTSLHPRQTFLHDPLRVLRLIRIGSKLGYMIEKETKVFMQNIQIHDALEAKVSRARIGIEVAKILKQPNPRYAFDLVYSFLAEFVYVTPSKLPPELVLPLKDNALMSKIIAKYNTFAKFIMQNGLETAQFLRPLLDGNEIMNLFGLKAGGAFLKRAIDEIVA
ncbi:poly(A) polymerase [Xylaria acuta]|nr:poly(A) polymerase [Xylaria acuta]